MKVWITKYALTAGIYEIEAEGDRHNVEIVKQIEPKVVPYAYFLGAEWWPTREDAVARAESMRRAKLASLRKSIAKLEGMVF